MNPLESWTEEQRSAFLYRACADAENGTVRAELFRRLAGEAEAQAAIWRAQLTRGAIRRPARSCPTRARGSSRPRRSGSARGGCKNVLAAMKVRGMADLRRGDALRSRPRAAAGRRRIRASPPRPGRRRQPARRRVRRQRRPGVEREPDPRRRRRDVRSQGRRADRRRRHGRRARSRWRPANTCRCNRSASSSSTRSGSSATS